MLGVVLAFVIVQRGLLVGLKRCSVPCCCITVLGMTPGLFVDHWVSSSLEWAMRVPLHMLVVLLF